MAICLVGTSVCILQNASEQRLLQNEVFQAVFDRYYQGKTKAFVQMVRISPDSAKI